MSAKIFRDPLYDYISIDKERDGWLLELLDSPEVQRLRRIHQLGISYLTYTGATHGRLSHSLGVVHLMQEALAHLGSQNPDATTEQARHSLLAAALVHDVGHGPFSHVFEPCLGIDHEAWSCAIIRSPESRVHRALRAVDGSLPEAVAALVEKGNYEPPLWQKNLLSSQLDVDRLDYLRRDSLFTGAGYGHFDWFRILHTFTLDERLDANRDLVWTERAKYALEEYIFARFYMYQNVYLHKTTRGFEKMVRALWARARQLRDEGVDVNLMAPLATFWDAATPSIEQYLALEEFVVLSQIQAWTGHSDRALSDLARRFLDRNRFGAVEAPPSAEGLGDDGTGEWQQALEELAARHGYAPADCYVLRDDLETTIYKTYVPEKESGEQHARNAIRLRVEGEDRPAEITRVLPRLQAVTGEPARQVRFYVPKEIHREALGLRRRWGKRTA
jgi:HD superfamily phosphohydrolase